MGQIQSAVDLYALDEDWTDEQKAICALVRKFVDKEILPHIGEWHEKASVPEDLIGKIGELGILEMVVANEMDPITYGLVMRGLERGGSGIRSIISVQGSLVLHPIMTYGSEAQKEQWIGPLSTFAAIGCFGLTEPDFGSNPAGMVTRAEQCDGGFRISGAKSWITNGTLADVAII